MRLKTISKFTNVKESSITIGSEESEIILDGHLTVKKTTVIEGDAGILGKTTTEEIQANENITAKKDVIVSGDIDISKNLIIQIKY